MKRLGSLLAAILFCGMACGSDEGLSQAEYPEKMAKVGCAHEFACCSPAERSTSQYKSEAECITYVKKIAGLIAIVPDENWSKTGAAEMLARLEGINDGCKRSVPDSELQRGVFKSTKNPGDQCKHSWECPSLICRSGVCANLPKNGESCDSTGGCEGGLYCPFPASKCAPLLADGAKCFEDGDCKSNSCGAGECVTTQTYKCDGKD